MIGSLLYILQWIFSLISVAIVFSVVSWPFLLNTTSFANMPYNLMGKEQEKERRKEINNKLLDWFYNDLFRFLLPTSAVIIVSGVILILLIGLISFVVLLISLLA